MKFGKQLRFVAVKNWFEHYVNYKYFKKEISVLRARLEEVHENGATDEEVIAIKQQFMEDFSLKLFKELNSVTGFFTSQYVSYQNELKEVDTDLKDYLAFSGRDDDVQRSFTKRISGITLKLYELRTFLEINKTAGAKIVKKVTKNIGSNHLNDDYASIEAQIFGNLPSIEDLLKELEELYVIVRRDVDVVIDKRPRKEIILELHNKVDLRLAWKQTTVLSDFHAIDFRKSEFLLLTKPFRLSFLIAAVAFFSVFVIHQFTENLEFSAQKCIGLVCFCSISWATGAIPIWITSLCIPLLTVIFKIIPDTDYTEIGKLVQYYTMSSTIFLIIGGFTIAAALTETELDKRIANFILRNTSANKNLFVLACMTLNAFIAMWISNVTSTMILVALITPTLRQLPSSSTFVRCLIFAIAVGGNIGGMLTPLSSPQNAVAIEVVSSSGSGDYQPSLSFTEFFATAVPFGVILLLISWGLLLWRFPVDIRELPTIQHVKTDFGWRQWTVLSLSLVVIILWIVVPFGGDRIFSDYGIVGLIPVILFYGIGILPPSTIGQLPWNIIFILMGGNVLSQTVQRSGLLEIVSDVLYNLLRDTHVWVKVFTINIIVIVIDFFLTHTVSSLIVLPIISDFALKIKKVRLFVMSAVMVITSQQILPVSSFPNLCCASITDEAKMDYLTTKEMIVWGLLITLVFFISVMTIYYGIEVLYGM